MIKATLSKNKTCTWHKWRKIWCAVWRRRSAERSTCIDTFDRLTLCWEHTSITLADLKRLEGSTPKRLTKFSCLAKKIFRQFGDFVGLSMPNAKKHSVLGSLAPDPLTKDSALNAVIGSRSALNLWPPNSEPDLPVKFSHQIPSKSIYSDVQRSLESFMLAWPTPYIWYDSAELEWLIDWYSFIIKICQNAAKHKTQYQYMQTTTSMFNPPLNSLYSPALCSIDWEFEFLWI